MEETFFADKSYGNRLIRYYYYKSVKKKLQNSKECFVKYTITNMDIRTGGKKKLLWHVLITTTAVCMVGFYIAITGNIHN